MSTRRFEYEASPPYFLKTSAHPVHTIYLLVELADGHAPVRAGDRALVCLGRAASTEAPDRVTVKAVAAPVAPAAAPVAPVGHDRVVWPAVPAATLVLRSSRGRRGGWRQWRRRQRLSGVTPEPRPRPHARQWSTRQLADGHVPLGASDRSLCGGGWWSRVGTWPSASWRVDHWRACGRGRGSGVTPLRR